MHIRYFALLAIVALLGSVLVYPMAAHALSAFCAPGAAATATATASPTPAISVPTSMATTGNVILIPTGASQATHDMLVCGFQQQNSATAILAGTGISGWFSMAPVNNWNGSSSVWTNLVGHCVQADDVAGTTTYTFTGLTNSSATDVACDLLRNTHCGVDVTGAENNDGASASTTITYPQIKTVTPNDMLIYFAVWARGTIRPCQLIRRVSLWTRQYPPWPALWKAGR